MSWRTQCNHCGWQEIKRKHKDWKLKRLTSGPMNGWWVVVDRDGVEQKIYYKEISTSCCC